MTLYQILVNEAVSISDSVNAGIVAEIKGRARIDLTQPRMSTELTMPNMTTVLEE